MAMVTAQDQSFVTNVTNIKHVANLQICKLRAVLETRIRTTYTGHRTNGGKRTQDDEG